MSTVQASPIKPKTVKQALRRQNPDKLKVDARNNFISRVRAGKSYRASTLATYGLTEESLQAELAKRVSPIATTKGAKSVPRTVDKVPVVSPSTSKFEAKQSNEANNSQAIATAQLIQSMQATINKLTNEITEVRNELANARAELKKAPLNTNAELTAKLEQAYEQIEKLRPAPPVQARKVYTVADYMADTKKAMIERHQAEVDKARAESADDTKFEPKKIDMAMYNIISQYFTAMKISDSDNVIELFSNPEAFYKRAKEIKKNDNQPYSVQTWHKNFRKFDMSIYHSPILQASLSKDIRDRFHKIYTTDRNAGTALQLIQRSKKITPIEQTYVAAANKYGNNSPQAFLVLLYIQCPARDDYGNMIYVDKMSDARSKQSNYLVLDTLAKTATLVFLRYKMDVNGRIEVDISAIYTDVVNYIESAGISVGKRLFPQANANKKLSPFVGKFLKELDINTGNQSIYYLRHAGISRLQLDPRFTNDADYILNVARIAMHSVSQNQTYTRAVSSDFIIADLLKNDDPKDD